jgi:hypothetical protein
LFYLSVGLGSAGAEHLRKQQGFDPALVELGLSILGPLGAGFFLLWLVTNGYAPLMPGLLCAVVGVAIFFRKGVRRNRFGSVEVASSLGVLSVGFTFILGAIGVISEVGQSLESIGIEYGPLARGGIWLATAGICGFMFKLWEWKVGKRNSEHTKRMLGDAKYRQRYEEKCRLEGQLKAFQVREEWYKREHTES